MPIKHTYHKIGIRNSENLKISNIEKIIIHLPEDSFDIVAKDKSIKSQPRTPYEAKFSIYWVTRISKHLNMKPGDFHEKYLKRDDESRPGNKIDVTGIDIRNALDSLISLKDILLMAR